MPWNWPDEELLAFYESLSKRPEIGRVYVGELSCTKRLPKPEVLGQILEVLAAGGKEAVLTTPPVIVTAAEFESIAKLMQIAPAVEANNHGLVSLWAERFSRKPLTLGPYLDVYNEDSAGFFKELGAAGVVGPVDLELPMLGELTKTFPSSTEVIAFGRQALAFSWRCYTSRHEGKLGRDCARQCRDIRHVRLETLEGEPVLRANGKTIYPELIYFPQRELDTFEAAGASILRIEPQAGDVSEALELVDLGIEVLSERSVGLEGSELDREYLAGGVKQRRTEPLGAGIHCRSTTQQLPHPLSLVAVPLLKIALRRGTIPLEPLEGRSFGLALKHGAPLVLQVKDGEIYEAPSGTRPDSMVRASLRTFLSIWFGRLDPDAAFFQRKAELSGSLTVSVTAKNVFDGFLR